MHRVETELRHRPRSRGSRAVGRRLKNAGKAPNPCRPHLPEARGVPVAPGGAKAGHASLLRPQEAAPDVPFACVPLRQSPNECRGDCRGRLVRWHMVLLPGRAEGSARPRAALTWALSAFAHRL
jgi:hypothetical protein